MAKKRISFINGEAVEVDEKGVPLANEEEGFFNRVARSAREDIGLGTLAGFPPGNLLDPAFREANPRTSNIMEGALTGAPLGPAGMIGGGLAGAITEPDAGQDVGGNVMERLAMKMLGPRAGLGSMLMRGAAAGAGTFAGGAVENIVLGEKVNVKSLVYVSTLTGAFSTAAEGLGKAISRISAAPARPIVRAINSLDTDPDAPKFTLTAQARLGRPRLADFLATTKAARRTVDEFQQYLDDNFPYQFTQLEAESMMSSLDEALGSARGSIREKLTRKALQEQSVDVSNVEAKRLADMLDGAGTEAVAEQTAAEFNRTFGGLTQGEATSQFRNLHGAASFEGFLRKVFGSASDPAATSLDNLTALKKLTAAMDRPDLFDAFSNEWIRRELIGKAVVPSSTAAAGLRLTKDQLDATAVLNGRKFARHIQQIGVERINETFGPKRGQALLAVAQVMELLDPSRRIRTEGLAVPETMSYMGRRMMFTLLVSGGAGAGGFAGGLENAATGAAVGGGVVVAAFGLARVAKAVLSNPTWARGLVRTIESANGTGISAFGRALISGELDAPSQATPRLTLRSLFQ